MIYKSDLFWLRKPLVSDAIKLYEISQDHDVMRYYGTPSFKSFAEARAEIDWFHTLEVTKMGSRWIITDTKNQCIGSLGYFNFNSGHGSVEVSYQLLKSMWGKGIMTKSLGLLIDSISKRPDIRFIIAYAHINNPASKKVLQKVGFEKVANFIPNEEEMKRLKDCEMFIYFIT